MINLLTKLKNKLVDLLSQRTIKVKPVGILSKIPTQATSGSGGFDLFTTEAYTLAPNGRWAAPVGIALGMPKGFVALICPKSGLAAKNGVTVLNGPGVIDSDYTGELKAILVNQDPVNEMKFEVGDKVAQLLFIETANVKLKLVYDLPATDRGQNGFGSTGKN